MGGSVFVALLFGIALLPGVNAAVGTFSYDNQSAWGVSCTAGSRQSPIFISSVDAVTNPDLEPLEMVQWDVPVSGNFTNTGSSVQFTPTTNNATLQNHRGLYTVAQFHFHWGENDTVGSEHKLDSTPYAAELHFVTRKTTGTMNEGDALSVVAVLFEADDDATDDSGPWAKLLPLPTENNANVMVTNIIFSEFLPSIFHYHYYEGSLTTPPCSEIVQWFVLRTPRKIPSSFLQKLREIKGFFNGTVIKDYRDVQPINTRTVSSFTGGSAGTPVCGMMPMVLAALFYFVITQFN